MAITKLNKTIKNFGESGYENTPVNKQLLQDICNKTDEIIDNLPIKNLVTAGDFNSLINEGSGLYVMYSSTANSPKLPGDVAMHWYVLQIVYGTSYCVQIAVGLHSDIKNIYIRNLVGGTWTSWVNASAGEFKLAENGYQIFPSGLTIQWGQISAALSSTEVTCSATFPKAFTNACFHVYANINDVGVNSTTLTSNVGCTSMSKTQASFKIKSTTNYAKDKNINLHYFAIGY